MKHHHHTVPKFYLKGFSIPDDPAFIWEYHRTNQFLPGHRRDKHNPVKRALSKASVITNYYGTIEDDLAEREEAAKPIIEKIRTSDASPRITQQEKEQLSDYIGLMIKRTTTGEQRTTSTWPTVMKKLRPQFERDIATFAYYGRFSDARKLQEVLDEFNHGMPTDLRHTSIKMPFGQVSTRIISLTWQFFTTTEPSFLTSDNPVRFPEHEGIGHPLAFLLFPISSTITLLASTQEFAALFSMPTEDDRSTASVSAAQVATLNHLTITGAQKYVYYHAAEEWITQSFA